MNEKMLKECIQQRTGESFMDTLACEDKGEDVYREPLYSKLNTRQGII